MDPLGLPSLLVWHQCKQSGRWFSKLHGFRSWLLQGDLRHCHLSPGNFTQSSCYRGQTPTGAPGGSPPASAQSFYGALSPWWACQVVLMVQNLPAKAGDTRDAGWSLGWEDPLERGTEPIPVFWPGESQGQRSLVVYSPWGCRVGHDQSDLACTQSHTAFLSCLPWIPVQRLCFLNNCIWMSQIKPIMILSIKQAWLFQHALS